MGGSHRQEIVEVSGNPESSENRASIVAVRVCRREERELMRRGRCRAYGTGYTRMRVKRYADRRFGLRALNRRLSMSRFAIFDSRVWCGIPSFAAAPSGPETRP